MMSSRQAALDDYVQGVRDMENLGQGKDPFDLEAIRGSRQRPSAENDEQEASSDERNLVRAGGAEHSDGGSYYNRGVNDAADVLSGGGGLSSVQSLIDQASDRVARGQTPTLLR